jgi:glycosyltransferase involved in cell wall biosynthesis
MTIGVKYIAYGNSSGYGLAGVAYARALHNAGVPVWWQPWFLGPRSYRWQPADGLERLPLAQAAKGDAALSDLPALIAAVARPIDYDTVVVHTVPEHWPHFVEAGRRMLGYTVWEADALPGHWPSLLNAVDAVMVPLPQIAELFAHGGVVRPVHAIPHIRRHAWSESAGDDAIALKLRLRIPDDHFVFYTIGAWDPRKAVDALVATFARTFAAEDRVSLLVKTSARASNAAAVGAGEITENAIREITREAERQTGRAAANIAVVAADDISGRTIDAIHAAGDCFVSLAHGEGWGMGAFDAAALGNPVIITGWGGPREYLGSDYPGLIAHRMTAVTGWQPHASYQATQRWAQADVEHAAMLMRAAAARDPRFAEAAVRIRETIVNRYAEPIVAKRFVAAIDG